MRQYNPDDFEVCSVFQRYNLKAIHNLASALSRMYSGVLSISKIQSESNSQLARYPQSILPRCAQYFKDTI